MPVAMLAGGAWAVAPDLPRMVRETVPDTLLASTLGARAVTQWLHEYGNWFMLHNWLDAVYAQPWQDARWGLRGIGLILILYNVMVFALFRGNDRLAAAAGRLQAQVVNLVRQSQPQTMVDAGDDGSAAPSLKFVQADQPDTSRRRQQRVASDDAIDAVAQSTVDQSMQTLRDAQLLDISDQGLAIMTSTATESGSMLFIRRRQTGGEPGGGGDGDEQARIDAVVLECVPHEDRYKLRCRSIGAQRPTDMFKQAA